MAATIYIVMSAEGGGSLDPFDVGHTFEEIGIQCETKCLKNGTYLLKTDSETTAEALVDIERLQSGMKVRVVPHPSLNGSRCAISCDALKDKSPEDIIALMGDQGVTGVQLKGNTQILTLSTPEPPKNVRVGALVVQTRRFTPPVKICGRCFYLGHTAPVCRNNPACKTCGGYHGVRCGGVPRCRYCGGKHLPTAKSCPFYRQERAINQLICDQKVSGAEARAIYRKKNKKTYIVPLKVDPLARAKPADTPNVPEPTEVAGPAPAGKKSGKSRKPPAEVPAEDTTKGKGGKRRKREAKPSTSVELVPESASEDENPVMTPKLQKPLVARKKVKKD